MGTKFSEMLVKLRKDAGFVTAYKFFYDNGGDKVLGMCYRKYLMMEQGRFLPQFKHLRAFIYGLHLQNRSAAANGLADAWLRTMAGDAASIDIGLRSGSASDLSQQLMKNSKFPVKINRTSSYDLEAELVKP